VKPAIGSLRNFGSLCALLKSMIIGTGLDLVDIARIDDSRRRFGERFLARIFTADEQAYCNNKAKPEIHYAARFAAKEACAKALGCGISGGVNFLDMEVVRDDVGKPAIELTGGAREIAANLAVATIHLSITHTKDQAAAVVVLEG